MLKQATLLLGLGLAISLTACSQAKPSASAPPPAKTSSPDTPKTDSTRNPAGRESGEGRRPGGRETRTQPEAVFTACESLAVGASCSVETPRGTRKGICRQRKGAERAFCAGERPSGARPEGRGEGQRPVRPGGE